MANPIPNLTLYTLALKKLDGSYTNMYSSYDRYACERKADVLIRNGYSEADLDIFPGLPLEAFRMEFGDGYYYETD